MNKNSVVTVYKVVTPGLKSGCDSWPTFPKELVVQYSTTQWVTGIANSKLFCFKDLERAMSYRANMSPKWNAPLDIWEAQAVGVTPKPRRLVVNSNLMSRFLNFWDNLLPWNHCGVTRGKKYFVADKIILVKRIENETHQNQAEMEF